MKKGNGKSKKRIPRTYMARRPYDRHDVDDFSSWTDRSVPTPELDSDPRSAEDALDPDKPRGSWTN